MVHGSRAPRDTGGRGQTQRTHGLCANVHPATTPRAVSCATTRRTTRGPTVGLPLQGLRGNRAPSLTETNTRQTLTARHSSSGRARPAELTVSGVTHSLPVARHDKRGQQRTAHVHAAARAHRRAHTTRQPENRGCTRQTAHHPVAGEPLADTARSRHSAISLRGEASSRCGRPRRGGS